MLLKQRDVWLVNLVVSPPQNRNLKAIVTKFEETGSILDAPESGRPRSSTTDAMGDSVTQKLQHSPNLFTRRLSKELQVSQRSVLRILDAKHLKSYH